MKSILLINDRVIGGGAEVVMQNIVWHLHDKYQITIMTFDDDVLSIQKHFPPNVKIRLFRVVDNPFSKINPFHYAIGFYNRLRYAVIQLKKYDIVITNKEGTCMKFASKIRANHRYGWIHVDYQYLYWTKQVFTAKEELRCMQKYDKLVCVSKSAAESVKKVIGDPGNIVVRYNPMDYRTIEEKAKDRIELYKDPNKLLFVAVGRIVAQKNFKTLAKVCAKLSKEYDFELWIIGDGEERGDVEMILQNENCSCVKIIGMTNNPYPYIAQADCCISTSLGESYGLVIQEALVLGVPVLTTRCPAIEECFNERFGIMFNCDEQSIEEVMRYVLTNPNCVDEYKKSIITQYNKEALWNERLESIEELLQ